jgi:hypothetical protein
VTGKTVTEIVERSGSIPNTIDYIYKDTKTGQMMTPAFIFEDTQKHLIYKDAMSLSAKLRYMDEEKTVLSELFNEFLESYDEPEDESDSSASSSVSSSSTTSPSSPKVIRITAAEKEAEKERKLKEKEEEKERKRLEKEEEKERKRKEKEEEKEQKRKEKEEEKEQKRKEKEEEEKQKRKEKEEQPKKSSPVATKKVVVTAKKSTASTSTVSTASTASTAASSSESSTVKPVVKVAKAAKAAPKNIPVKPVVFTIPNDGYAHKWEFEGKLYMANSDRLIWTRDDQGEASEWVGVFIPEENRINTSIPEPEYV